MSNEQTYKGGPKRFPSLPSTQPFLKYHYPPKNVDETALSKIFVVVLDNDFNKIKKFISESNITFTERNQNGESLIHTILNNPVTTEKQKYDLISYFLKQGTPVDAFDKYNRTPLHLAAKYQFPNIIDLLIKNGANPNSLDSSRMNPLHYAVQGEIKECKVKKKVGSIIKEEPTEKPRTYSKDELKELSAVIVDIFGSEHFNKFLQNIKNSIDTIDEIFPDYFRQMESSYFEEITNILKDVDYSDQKKKELLESKSSESINSINKEIEQKLKNSITELKEEWKSGDINKLNDLMVPILNRLTTSVDTKYNDLKNVKLMGILKNMTTITKNIQNDVDNMNTNMIHIFELNRFIRENYRKKVTATNWKVWDQNQISLNLVDYYSYNYNGNQLNYPEFFVDGLIPNSLLDFNVREFKNPFETIKIYRGTVKDIESWEKEKEKNKGFKLIKTPLTNDGDNVYRSNDPVLTGSTPFPDPINIKLSHNKGGYYTNNNLPLYFNSKLNYFNQRSQYYLKNISENLNKLFEQLDSDFTFLSYRTISYILISILNMIQNIIFTIQDKEYIINQFNKLNQDLLKLFQTTDHPYNFALEQASNLAKECVKITEYTFEEIDKLYEVYNQLIESLNEIIDIINERSTNKYIQKYFRNDDNTLKPFKEQNLSLLNNIWHFRLDHIKKLPTSVSSYKEKYIITDNLDQIRKKLYEEQMPTINKWNYSTYLSSKNINIGTIYFPFVFYPYDSFNQDWNSVDNRDSKIGYILPNNFKVQLGPNFVPLPDLPALPYDNSKKNILGEDITELERNNGDHIGHFGYYYIRNNFINRNRNVLPIIGHELDTHFLLLKMLILQNVINLFENNNSVGVPPSDANPLLNIEVQNKINQTKTKIRDMIKKIGIEHDENKFISSIISRITDELLSSFIKERILSKTTRIINSITKTINQETYNDILKNIRRDLGQNILRRQIMEINLNKLFDEIINQFNTHDNLNDDIYGSLKFTSKIMLDQESPDDQFKMYEQNYNNQTEITEKVCLKIDPEIVKKLIKYGTNVNQQDKSFSSPLYYAIQQLNSDIVKILVKEGNASFNRNLKDTQDRTPLRYLYDSFYHHRELIGDNLIKGFVKEIEKSIKEILESKSEYKNNIIKYYFNIFPTVLVMYNNLFHMYMSKYYNGWSYEDTEKLKKVLNIKDEEISLFDPSKLDISNILLKKDDLDVLSEEMVSVSKSKDKEKKLRDSYQYRLDNIDKEINKLRTGVMNNFVQTYINFKNSEKTKLLVEIGELNAKLGDKDNKYFNLFDKIEDKFNRDSNNWKQNLSKFKTHRRRFKVNSVSEFYDNVFNYVIDGNDPDTKPDNIISTGFEDFNLYNDFWQAYLNTDMNDFYNLNNVVYNYTKHGSDFEIIAKLFNKVLIPIVEDYNNLPYKYSESENYVLNDVADIFVHVVKHTICASLYYTLIKVITKYAIDTAGSQNIYGRGYDEYIRRIVFNYMDYNHESSPANPDPKLKNYIVDEMPKLMVKHVLKLYEDDNDPAINIDSLDSLFGHVEHLILLNNTLPLSTDSDIIKQIRDKIFKYYIDLSNLVIHQMKNLIDNYNRFIINEGRYINIINIMRNF